jgi:hypothetical protein
MSFEDDLLVARTTIDRNAGAPEFHGNDRVPILRETSEGRLVDYLATFRKADGIGGQVHELVAILATRPWKITAGIHKGGLGGAAGGPDRRPHLTLSTGHHLRFGNDSGLIEITGNGISMIGARAQRAAAAAAATAAAAMGGNGPPPGQTAVHWLVNTYDLTENQAVKVISRQNRTGESWASLARTVKEGR